MCAQVSAELPSSPPGGSTWLEEVVDEGETRRSKGSSGATCTGLRMNTGQVCGAVSGRKRVTLRSRIIEEICGGIHHCRERRRETQDRITADGKISKHLKCQVSY